MKLIFFTISIVFSVSLRGQLLVDFPPGKQIPSQYIYSARVGDQWKDVAHEDFTFDPEGRLATWTETTPDNETGTPHKRAEFTYPNDTLVIETTSEWDGKKWQPFTKTHYITNTRGFIQRIDGFNEVKGKWKPSVMGSIEYAPGTDIVLSIIYQSFKDSVWVNADRTMYRYSERHVPIIKTFQQWENGNWNKGSTTAFFYKNGGKNPTSTIDETSRVKYQYEGDLLKVRISQEMENGKWVDKFKRTSEYLP